MASLSEEKGVPDIDSLTLSTWGESPKYVDEELYSTQVLLLPQGATEDTVDQKLQQELDMLGLTAPAASAHIDSLASSLSTNTFSSDSTVHAPRLCSSPEPMVPSSVSSSEQPDMSHTAAAAQPSIPFSQSSPVLSTRVKRRSTGFRLGFLKMTAYTTSRKRRSMPSWSPTATSISSEGAKTHDSDRTSQQSALRSQSSVESSKSSSWTKAVSAPGSSYEQSVCFDAEAIQRSLECQEMQDLRRRQMAERDRFLHFQRTLRARLEARREEATAAKRKLHEAAVAEQQHKTDVAVDKMESRHLEEEIKLQKEQELEKQRALVRLRHMEAYCHSQSRPQTPHDPGPGRASTNAAAGPGLPERRVTDKDYHSLAQQYRERDSMASLHAAKVNVLRGKQNKALERLVRKGMQEIDKLDRRYEQELEAMAQDFARQQDGIRLSLTAKQARLEMRWRIQALITRTQAERRTGLKHSALPEVTVAQDSQSPLVSS